jgi:hypothetical protein
MVPACSHGRGVAAQPGIDVPSMLAGGRVRQAAVNMSDLQIFWTAAASPTVFKADPSATYGHP